MYSEADLADIGRRIGRCRAVLIPVIVLLGALPLYPLYRDYCKKYFSRF